MSTPTPNLDGAGGAIRQILKIWLEKQVVLKSKFMQQIIQIRCGGQTLYFSLSLKRRGLGWGYQYLPKKLFYKNKRPLGVPKGRRYIHSDNYSCRNAVCFFSWLCQTDTMARISLFFPDKTEKRLYRDPAVHKMWRPAGQPHMPTL